MSAEKPTLIIPKAPPELKGAWIRAMFDLIPAGSEGEIGHVTLKRDGVELAGYVEKELGTLEEAQRQRTLFCDLKKRSIPTFDLFLLARRVQKNKETIVAITEDRTRGEKGRGQKWCISPNNIDLITRPRYFTTLSRIPAATKEQLIWDLFMTALQTAQPNKNGVSISLQPDKKYSAFPLLFNIDPHNLQDAQILVGDFGPKDIAATRQDTASVLKTNLRAAYSFASCMFGFFGTIPENHPAAAHSDFFSAEEWEDIAIAERFFLNQLPGYKW